MSNETESPEPPPSDPPPSDIDAGAPDPGRISWRSRDGEAYGVETRERHHPDDG